MMNKNLIKIGKQILIMLAAIIAGGFINGILIKIGASIIPAPSGTNINTPEGFKEAIKLFEPKNYLFPFLAHALGTLLGAFIAAYFSANNKMWYSLIVGFVFFLGGLSMVLSYSGAMWFNILDLVGAYFPFAILGYKLAGNKRA